MDKYFSESGEANDFVNRPVGTATLATLRATQAQLEKVAKKMSVLEVENAELRQENEKLKVALIGEQAHSGQASYVRELEEHVERLEKQLKEVLGTQRSVSTSSKVDSPVMVGRSLRDEMLMARRKVKAELPHSPNLSRSSSIFSSNKDVEQYFEHEFKDDASIDSSRVQSHQHSAAGIPYSTLARNHASPTLHGFALADHSLARKAKEQHPHEKPFVPAGKLTGAKHDPYLRIPLHVRAATRRNPADSKPRITVNLD